MLLCLKGKSAAHKNGFEVLVLRAASNFPTEYVMNSFADLCFTTYFKRQVYNIKITFFRLIFPHFLFLLVFKIQTRKTHFESCHKLFG